MKNTSFVVLPLIAAMATMPVYADVVVTDIGFNGLNRITTDSMYSVLPISAGSMLTEASLADSIKAIYNTGNFENIQSQVVDGKVIFDVVERPLISSLNFDGNKLIPTKGLEEGLKAAGLSAGNVLKQSVIEGIASELKQQYVLQGYYNSNIDIKQTIVEGNRVNLDFIFDEGKAAEVATINIQGNKHFSDGDIRRAFLLKESSWYHLLSKSNRFAKDKLAVSLEKLKAMYLNEGFVRFNVTDYAVQMSDDNKDVVIDLVLSEGEQYDFGKVKFIGDTIYGDEALSDLVSFKPNDLYSQEKLTETASILKNHYGDDGSYFAKIRPVTRINDATKTVDVDFYIDPAQSVYVRRINFSGNTRTKDEVLRREMRQLEGALASNSSIEQSKTRLMRTGYFKSVEGQVVPVPNQPDQVDINYVVEEQSTGSSSIAAGYSQNGGVTYQADLAQKNFLGTGNAVNLGFTRSQSRDSYSLGLTNPYFTENGVSQSMSAYYRKTKYDDSNINNYVADSIGATLRYGYPVNEKIRLNAGMNIDNTKIRGGEGMAKSQVKELLDDGGTTTGYKLESGKTISTFQNDYTTYNLLLGWNYSSLDKPVFPTKGISHDVDLTLGFGDKNYQKGVYKTNIYQPVYKDFIMRGYGKLGYGNNLPFYENFYAGGAGSVRGYDASSLGPVSESFDGTKSINVGGNAVATVGAELILPMPFKGDWTAKVRPALFVEGGQVFDTTDSNDLINDDKDPRFSVGAGVTWLTPIGPVSFSYSKPFNNKKTDQTEAIQFQIGSIF